MDRRRFVAAGAAFAVGGISFGALAREQTPNQFLKQASKIASDLRRGLSPVDGTSGEPLFPTGALADNMVARGFGLIPDLQQPLDIGYDTANGPQSFSSLTGKVRILALWANWCRTCLQEMPELAVLQARHGDDSFEILSLLTANMAMWDFATARKILDDAGAQALPLWVESLNGDRTMALAVARPPSFAPNSGGIGNSMIIPCAVLIDAKGQVRGHMIGASPAPVKREPSQSPPFQEVSPTVWSTPDADIFIDALKAGVLA